MLEIPIPKHHKNKETTTRDINNLMLTAGITGTALTGAGLMDILGVHPGFIVTDTKNLFQQPVVHGYMTAAKTVKVPNEQFGNIMYAANPLQLYRQIKLMTPEAQAIAANQYFDNPLNNPGATFKNAIKALIKGDVRLKPVFFSDIDTDFEYYKIPTLKKSKSFGILTTDLYKLPEEMKKSPFLHAIKTGFQTMGHRYHNIPERLNFSGMMMGMGLGTLAALPFMMLLKKKVNELDNNLNFNTTNLYIEE